MIRAVDLFLVLVWLGILGSVVGKKVLFVSIFGYTPTTYMALVCRALPHATDFNTEIDYRFVTYRDHAHILDNLGLDHEKLLYFNHSSSLMDNNKRMEINQRIAIDNLQGIAALLTETAQRNYKNEVEELWAVFAAEKPDLLVIDCLATR